jgi:hypothetical protein
MANGKGTEEKKERKRERKKMKERRKEEGRKEGRIPSPKLHSCPLTASVNCAIPDA